MAMTLWISLGEHDLNGDLIHKYGMLREKTLNDPKKQRVYLNKKWDTYTFTFNDEEMAQLFADVCYRYYLLPYTTDRNGNPTDKTLRSVSINAPIDHDAYPFYEGIKDPSGFPNCVERILWPRYENIITLTKQQIKEIFTGGIYQYVTKHRESLYQKGISQGLDMIKHTEYKKEDWYYVLTEEELASMEQRKKMSNTNSWDLRHEKGPFDIIGDVHGCADELKELLIKLGYSVGDNSFVHGMGRKLIFVGDLVDRGPENIVVIDIVGDVISNGQGWCVSGNHDNKLLRALKGNNVIISDGLDITLKEIKELKEENFLEKIIEFLNGLSLYYVFDEGKLVVAHAWITPEYFGSEDPIILSHCMYGLTGYDDHGRPIRTLGAKNILGYPIRYDWAQDYKGDTFIAYGHTVVDEAKIINNTIDIDTGCVFGGKLTAFRYPEMEIVSVPAKKVYY